MSDQVKKHKTRFRWSDAYLYLIPWLIGIVVFRFYPFIEAFRISLYNERIGRPPEFVGLGNFSEILNEIFINISDFLNLGVNLGASTPSGQLFRDSLMVTFRYVFLTVPLVLVVALFVAFILNFKIKGIGFFRTAFYIPSILGGSVAIAVLWRTVWGNQGLINSFIRLFGNALNALPFVNMYVPEVPVGWMVQGGTALLVMSILRAWQFGSAMLIFLSALQNVPTSLYEAASIDGAKKWRQFLTITVPIITPTILFNTIQLLVAAFQEFNAPYLVPAQPGGPNNATLLLNVFIYQRAFQHNNFGIAGAASWIMFILIMIATMVIFKFSNRWVFYND